MASICQRCKKHNRAWSRCSRNWEYKLKEKCLRMENSVSSNLFTNPFHLYTACNSMGRSGNEYIKTEGPNFPRTYHRKPAVVFWWQCRPVR